MEALIRKSIEKFHLQNQRKALNNLFLQYLPKLKMSIIPKPSNIPLDLPVPPLEETLRLYLRTLKPLLDKDEYRENIQALGDTLKKTSVSWKLWDRLKAKANNTETSWLYDYWNEYAYMSVRDPLVPGSSYFFCFKDQLKKTHSSSEQASRAANITSKALIYRYLILSNKLQREYQQKYPLCMKQYQYLFHTCRIPTANIDTSYKCDDPKKNEYICVISNDCYYLIHFTNQKTLPIDYLEMVFKYILEDSAKRNGTCLGYLTLENRDVWAKCYTDLIKRNKLNSKALSSVNNSAFIVCLDSSSPNNRLSLARGCFFSNGRNRFNDKSTQFIVFKNGKAGFLGEHSMMDAVPTRNLCEFVLSLSDDEISKEVNMSNYDYNKPEKVVEYINTDVGPEIQSIAHRALNNYYNICNNKSMYVLYFDAFGKEKIKTFKLSPDSFIQMSFQLAYYALHKRFCPVYETSSTRIFKYGRTEVIRSLSEESKEWVLLMNDPNASDKTKYDALVSAIKSHKFYAGMASAGHGVDRLILGLKSVLKESETLPPLLLQPALQKSSHWTLSTSQVASENFDGYGWSNVVSDGYGLPYLVNKYEIYVTVASSLPLEAEPMAQQIKQSLMQMENLALKFTSLNTGNVKPTI